MAVQNGTVAFAAASGTTAATRLIWACAAAMLGAAVLTAPVTRGPFRHTAAFSASGALTPALDGLVNVAHFRVPAYTTGANANRFDAAPASVGAGSFRAVTASDTIALDPGCRGLFVSVGGTLAVKGIFDGTAASLGTLTAGTTIPGRFGYVMLTGTTATVIALYS